MGQFSNIEDAVKFKNEDLTQILINANLRKTIKKK